MKTTRFLKKPISEVYKIIYKTAMALGHSFSFVVEITSRLNLEVH
jgi:hypothetical protein